MDQQDPSQQFAYVANGKVLLGYFDALGGRRRYHNDAPPSSVELDSPECTRRVDHKDPLRLSPHRQLSQPPMHIQGKALVVPHILQMQIPGILGS